MSNDENYDHEYWNGLAIIVGAAAALCAALLLCGCSTIRDAVDEYRDWRDSQTNAPAVSRRPPSRPVVTAICRNASRRWRGCWGWRNEGVPDKGAAYLAGKKGIVA